MSSAHQEECHTEFRIILIFFLYYYSLQEVFYVASLRGLLKSISDMYRGHSLEMCRVLLICKSIYSSSRHLANHIKQDLIFIVLLSAWQYKLSSMKVSHFFHSFLRQFFCINTFLVENNFFQATWTSEFLLLFSLYNYFLSKNK